MKLAIVSRQLPEREGTGPGRVLRAACDGLVDAGHELAVWSWGPTAPTEELPSWCEWRPLPSEPAWRTRVRALRLPRADVVRAGWGAPCDAMAVADDVPSYGAVHGAPRSAVTFHYRTAVDAAALHRWTPFGPRRPGTPRWRAYGSPPGVLLALRDVQDRRAERRAAAAADVVLTYSLRAAGAARGRARFIPIPVTPPAHPAPPVDEPVAAVLADWQWPPNRAALATLLGAWPEVRSRVTGARLLLAGRNLELARVGTMPGVELMGPVGCSADLLSQAAVVPFPCPPTSGPKVKVLEAIAHGVAVVTTPAGVEGLLLGDTEGLVFDEASFAAGLTAALADAGRRDALARKARVALLASHAPAPAAHARVAALSPLWASRR